MPLPKQSDLTKEEQKEALESTAIRYLSYRPRFKSEVINHLGKKAKEISIGDPFTLINQIVISLENSGFINDPKLLESYIHSRLWEKVKGPYWIKARLLHLGLVKSEIENALRQFAGRSDQLEVLAKYLNRKSYVGFVDLKTKAKIFRRLIGRGFSADLVAEAFDQSRSGE
ncbi:hypothetical protein A3A84_01825 [Candidatus Collierbacteria bacterium RIFCSPLOWO2_01_FULL_50_23]|uniref:Regulatory protein RecX n=2 Tax=Candidatus Collieribacteriota TaxID=1752725 RepID=A0A1F5EWN9_9BACT|nr:MAG: hypothetical protein A3D09_00450 [Candidatus Collierbacteria bacterium RIFCSPHIGHO2_02_FULL_49_10]OGD72179.1 MAG: hypothetical protein A2703_00115 [Candidatus Collierbacteria bacterium RIFCSPHIGHO2_01_FULL_50_25]OGD74134.1 MAG: hypothetical protein A3A84_01825 [Candidatus Collierbacteria bacterium RIFCSPLOWO2_01_FULL_50_23]